MGKIVNKRNAVLGWAVWRLGKRSIRKKVDEAVPAVEGGRPNRSAVVATVAAVGGVLLFWRKKKGSADVAE
jgi:hypothetical protein